MIRGPVVSYGPGRGKRPIARQIYSANITTPLPKGNSWVTSVRHHVSGLGCSPSPDASAHMESWKRCVACSKVPFAEKSCSLLPLLTDLCSRRFRGRLARDRVPGLALL